MTIELKLPTLPDGYRWQRFAQPYNKITLMVVDENDKIVAETGKHGRRVINLFVGKRVARQVMNLALARERANSEWAV